jgi:hypothetical protein
MSIFLPFILRILGAILDKYLQRQESRQAWIDFIEAASKEGLNSVKLAKMAGEQRDRLARGEWQKPEGYVPPVEVKPVEEFLHVEIPRSVKAREQFVVTLLGVKENTNVFAERVNPLGMARLQADGKYQLTTKFSMTGNRVVGFEINDKWIESNIEVQN